MLNQAIIKSRNRNKFWEMFCIESMIWHDCSQSFCLLDLKLLSLFANIVGINSLPCMKTTDQFGLRMGLLVRMHSNKIWVIWQRLLLEMQSVSSASTLWKINTDNCHQTVKSNKRHYQCKVFVCVPIISWRMRIIAQMRSINFYYFKDNFLECTANNRMISDIIWILRGCIYT